MNGRQRQLPLSFKRHGGQHRGAGRKPKGERPGTPHRVRPALAARHPVHVTLRVSRAVRSLRRRQAYRAIVASLTAVKGREDMRVVHYSVMTNHRHLIVEVTDRIALARGVQGLSIRMARALDRLQGAVGATTGGSCQNLGEHPKA